jgi:hypothetical protein
MAQPPTYQELLAEVFEENAKNVLVYQQEFENDDAEPYEDEDYSDNELEDKDEFNKFHGNRGKPEHVIKPKATTTQAGKVSYNIDRHIRTYAINIDGRFRGSILITKPATTCDGSSTTFLASNSANFAFNSSRQYKNVHSIRVTSFEFYNSFYTYSAINSTTGLGRGNTTFTFLDFGPIAGPFPSTPLNTYDFTIQDGNYVIVDPTLNPGANDTNILYIIQQYIRTTVPGYNTAPFNVGIDGASNLVYFEDALNYFAIQFPTTTDNPNGNGLGYNLGFYGTYYQSGVGPVVPPYYNGFGNSINGETFYDSVEDTYVYLKINDYQIIKHLFSDQTEFGAFMKIPLTSPKNAIQFMSSTTNTTQREYTFPQPTNISSFLFEMCDAYGKTLQMNGSTFSVTLEIQEILQSDIYEKMLEL